MVWSSIMTSRSPSAHHLKDTHGLEFAVPGGELFQRATSNECGILAETRIDKGFPRYKKWYSFGRELKIVPHL
jgi:hypothetical protein